MSDAMYHAVVDQDPELYARPGRGVAYVALEDALWAAARGAQHLTRSAFVYEKTRFRSRRIVVLRQAYKLTAQGEQLLACYGVALGLLALRRRQA